METHTHNKTLATTNYEVSVAGIRKQTFRKYSLFTWENLMVYILVQYLEPVASEKSAIDI